MIISMNLARSRMATAIETKQPPGVIALRRQEYLAARLAHRIRADAASLNNVQRAELCLVLVRGDGAT